MARYIDADKIRQHFIDMVRVLGREISVNYIVHAIDKQPSADVEEVKHGKWLQDFDEDFYCSACGRYPKKDVDSYCPNCGADMRGGKNDL